MSSEKKEKKTLVGSPPGMPEMTQKRTIPLTDRFGNTFHIGNAGEFWLPPFPTLVQFDYRDNVKAVRDFEVRDGDVMICSFPKTGTHWNSEIINMLLNGSAEYENLNHNARGLMEMGTVFTASQVEGPRLINTHLPPRHVPQQAFSKNIKIILCNRNPKDTIVSFFHHLRRQKAPMGWPGDNFEHFYYWMMELGGYFGGNLDYYMGWQDTIEAHPNAQIYISMFEDMKEDPVEAVIKLNNFLETGRSRELCEEIANACQFDKLKEGREALMPEYIKNIFKEGKVPFFRKGDVGDWRNHFTVAMNEHFEEEYTRRMKDYKTIFRYTL